MEKNDLTHDIRMVSTVLRHRGHKDLADLLLTARAMSKLSYDGYSQTNFFVLEIYAPLSDFDQLDRLSQEDSRFVSRAVKDVCHDQASAFDDIYFRLDKEAFHDENGIFEETEPTGWTKINRAIYNAQKALESASTASEFTSVGHSCRIALETLGDTVHPHEERIGETIKPKDILLNYINLTLVGEKAKKHRDLIGAVQRIANGMEHNHDTSSRFDATECLIATKALVDLFRNLSERDAQETADRIPYTNDDIDDLPF